jgi:hypothetical protein
MEYTISENRLRNLFVNYMDTQYELEYDAGPREFTDKNSEVFGYLIQNQFYYGFIQTEYSLNELFGELTNELLFHYLRERFPDVIIDGIE